MNENKLKKDFPVVCIGGSAGSLMAFKGFLRFLPSDAGVAVIVINHVRNQDTHLHEILSGYTKMPVSLIQDKLEIKNNHVYVIPSNRELYIENHEFRFRNITKIFGWPNVITLFFNSLAENWKGIIMTVIVSGLDHDGADALHHIKEAGGITFAQKPETAQVSDMPKSAIESGWIDYILTPEEIGEKIADLAKRDQEKRL